MHDHSPIRLVCFDLGGVLIRICRSWEEACATAGVPVRGECRNGFPCFAGWAELSTQFGMGQITGEQWSTRLSESSGGLYSAKELRTIHDSWLLGEYEGVAAVIDRLHAVGMTTAALSNTNADHWPMLHAYPAFMRLHHRLASHELGLLKPDARIYREFEQRVNGRSTEILFFDDLSPNVDAAREAGWRAELIDPLARTDQQIEAALLRHGVLRPQ